jgi:hypothetical protein
VAVAVAAVLIMGLVVGLGKERSPQHLTELPVALDRLRRVVVVAWAFHGGRFFLGGLAGLAGMGLAEQAVALVLMLAAVLGEQQVVQSSG